MSNVNYELTLSFLKCFVLWTTYTLRISVSWYQTRVWHRRNTDTSSYTGLCDLFQIISCAVCQYPYCIPSLYPCFI